jgi:hypothetical protein
MDRPGQQFFSRAGFAKDEDGAVCLCYLLDLSQNLFHRKTLPYNLRMLTQELNFLVKVDVLTLESLLEFLDLPEALLELLVRTFPG